MSGPVLEKNHTDRVSITFFFFCALDTIDRHPSQLHFYHYFNLQRRHLPPVFHQFPPASPPHRLVADIQNFCICRPSFFNTLLSPMHLGDSDFIKIYEVKVPTWIGDKEEEFQWMLGAVKSSNLDW
ncbi:hypothetical protein Lser_V15G30245 [Lactuca serriola]